MAEKTMQLTEKEKRAQREAIKKLVQEQNERWEKVKQETEEIIARLE